VLKLLSVIENFTKIISENIAREVNRSEFLRVTLGGLFIGTIALVANPLNTLAGGNKNWCAIWYKNGTCDPPRGTYCSGCPTSSTTTKCPSGYVVSTAWYATTGCWCHYSTSGGSSTICCDCVKSGTSTTSTSNSTACGCKFTTSGR